MGQQTGWPVTDVNAELKTPGSLAVAVGDLMYASDTTNGYIKRADQLADLGTAALQQADFARKFVGVSKAQCLSTDATIRQVPVLIDGLYEFVCESATFLVGDYVGASYNANVLRNQTVAKVSFPHLAIGRVEKMYSAATTKVKCRLMSRYLLGIPDRFRDVGACGQGTGITAMADANTTLTVDSNPVQTMTPTVDRTVTLPAVAQSAGLVYTVHNLATNLFFLNVKNAGATFIGIVGPGETGYFFCDGATWHGITAKTGNLGNVQYASNQIQAKTADYTVLVTDSGTVFTNTGAAGSVNFTLPAVANAKGFSCEILGVVDQQIAVTAPAGTLVGANNAARTSYTDAASGNRIGVSRKIICDGAKYYLFVDLKGLTIGTYA